MNLKFFFRIGLGALGATLLAFLVDWTWSATSDYSFYAWLILSNLLVVALIGYFIVHSTLSGIGLILTVLIFYFGIGSFNTLIEAYIFNLIDLNESLSLILKNFVIVLLTSAGLVYFFNGWGNSEEKPVWVGRPAFSWTWRIIAGDLLYVLFYLLAGLALISIYPELIEFYSEKTVPPPALIFGTQLGRGLVFVGIAILINRSVNLSRGSKAVFIGLVFSIIGGIAPLILPNEIMPVQLRMGHMFEVGISNFLYGWILGYLISQKRNLSIPETAP